jgi:hypothetical protein
MLVAENRQEVRMFIAETDESKKGAGAEAPAPFSD